VELCQNMQIGAGILKKRAFNGSTVSFRYYLLGSDTAASSGLLARLCHTFLVFLFFLFLLGAKLAQYLLDRFSRSFHQMEGICVNFLDQVHFFRFLKGRCHGNQFCGKITYPSCTYRSVIQKRYLITPRMCKIK